MIDVATLRRVAVASGGSRGDVVITTSDGRVLLSQTTQVDVLGPLTAGRNRTGAEQKLGGHAHGVRLVGITGQKSGQQNPIVKNR